MQCMCYARCTCPYSNTINGYSSFFGPVYPLYDTHNSNKSYSIAYSGSHILDKLSVKYSYCANFKLLVTGKSQYAVHLKLLFLARKSVRNWA